MGEDKVAADRTGLFSIMRKDDDGIENPKNILQGFSGEKIQIRISQEFSQQPDLSLGLSLGGLYGQTSEQNNNNKKPLARSSSVAVSAGGEPKTLPPATNPSYLSLSRSCSLPLESEKRMIELKDFQTMVTKKRQRNCRVSFEDEKSQPPKEVTVAVPPKEVTVAVPPAAVTLSETVAWAASSATQSPALCRAIFKIKTLGHGIDGKQGEGHEDLVVGKKILGATQSLPEKRDKEPAFSFQPTANGKSVETKENKLENPMKKAEVSNGIVQENGMDVMTKMPSVSCVGDGPNGRRIEGFLYKYTKSQVSIVCVCHGSFLTPAEFVRHAGGKDVENPMRRINVISTPFLY